MRIKSYKTTRFAGLKDVDLEFQPGLNVILGANESGKSTIIDGIYSTLFKDIKLRGSSRADKDFIFKFMPKPSGDFIDGKLVIESAHGEYKISKEWGTTSDIKLLDPRGSIIKDQDEIDKILEELLSHGENTYSNIVFAKQRELKEALHNIVGNREINREVNDLLRRTLMELDGISLDKLESDIEIEIENLYKRWDREKNFPENNRGISNPYKVGLGKIVESFYHMEGLKLNMEDADRSEKSFKEIVDKIKEIEDEKSEKEKKKKVLEAIEEDVTSRQLIEERIKSLDKDSESLKKINKDWPKAEFTLEALESREKEIVIENEKLDIEKKNLEKWERKEKLKKKLESIKEIEKKKKNLEAEIKEIPPIDKDDIKDLEGLNREISTLETTMKAGKMIGHLKKSKGKVYISKDFGPDEILELKDEFQANGWMNIRYGDEFEIQIQTGEMDFQQLNDDYKVLKEKYKNTLGKLAIDSLETGKLNLGIIQKLQDDNENFKKDIERELDKNSKLELEEEFEKLEEIKETRNPQEIEEAFQTMRKQELETVSDMKTERAKIEAWKEEYENMDSLFELLGEKNFQLRGERSKLEKLKPLPEEYNSSEEFKEDLKALRNSLELIRKDYEDLKENYYKIQSNLSDTSHEELEKEYKQAEKEFNKNIHRGEKLLEIRKVFLETKEKLSKDPMEPLVKEFVRLLEIVTAGSYTMGDMDEEFNLKIENLNGEMPIELLSAGTYDAVTLALRFTLLKWLFKDGEGYVVLDDCLVDLDPERKQQSVALISEFAKDYQIIFTTCDPETAKMLGGNIIEL